MKKILCKLSACVFILLVNTTTLRAELSNTTLPLYPYNSSPHEGSFYFQYAEFTVPDFIKYIYKTSGPWLRIIKTESELQNLYIEAFDATFGNLSFMPLFPSIDFEHYQLVMGGTGLRCTGTNQGKLGIYDITEDINQITITAYLECAGKLIEDLSDYRYPSIAILMTKTNKSIAIKSIKASFQFD